MIAPLLASLSLVLQTGKADLPAVLFFTHSAGFVHDVVKRPEPGKLAPAEHVLTQIGHGPLPRDVLAGVRGHQRRQPRALRAVVFMTTSTQEKDLPIPGNGNQELVDWVAHGGAFIGIHCATDTNYNFAPYVAMIGGSFDGIRGTRRSPRASRTRRVRSPPSLGASFVITDEIYQFKNCHREPLRVLLTLDPASADLSLGKRADKDYALAWAHDWGEGRVFYSALGHREEVWRDPRFQGYLLNGIDWAIRGPDLPAPPPRRREGPARWQEPRVLEAQGRQGRGLEARRRRHGGRRRQGRPRHQGSARRRLLPRRVPHPFDARRHRPGARQQRRLPADPLRDPGARLLWPEGGARRLRLDLRQEDRGRERVPEARALAELRHRVPRAALRRQRQGRPPTRASPPGRTGA
jgi:type 1 glutamine amidotransferase